MSDINAKSYYEGVKSSTNGEARGLISRVDFTSAPDFDTALDIYRFFRVAEGAYVVNGVFEFSATDGGAGAGRVDVILTDGTTTHVLAEAADVSAAGIVRFGNAAGALDWVGQEADGDGWYIALRVDTTFSAAAASGHYALAITLVTNP